MAKTRVNRKEIRRLRQKQGFAVATEVRLLAERLPNQAALDTFLLQVDDIVKRRRMFDYVKPFLKFRNPECPSTMERPRIILP